MGLDLIAEGRQKDEIVMGLFGMCSVTSIQERLQRERSLYCHLRIRGRRTGNP